MAPRCQRADPPTGCRSPSSAVRLVRRRRLRERPNERPASRLLARSRCAHRFR
jgi:hypothetical protein